MNTAIIKPLVCFALMVVFMIMAFITKEVLASYLFASLVIVLGAIAFKSITTDKQTNNYNS